ncbi:quaternary amine ABC transporter ATP-binding protein [Mangrovicella endophytica]|uniref:quaternary amine ABC transporter ATP-binding protein n=1 Tax=Mangrovicella endophytica TaxID=2066697 RepID=UPI000C9E1855|nr:betaine/proline/choline family ABC transporter ATP-binding protein [Mangrovicella endophytica]
MADARSGEPAIRIRDLVKIFGSDEAAGVADVRAGLDKPQLLARNGQVLALDGIDLDVAAGSIQVVMGLSGSGKSTLVRHVNRLIEPSAGSIAVLGEDVLAMSPRRLRDFRRRHISMVFQRFALLPHRTVRQNVAYGLKIIGRARHERREAAMRWIERVGLGGYEDAYPAQLSGGMQQRVGLARALATDADILLMDEAFSALDPLIRADMQSVLLGLQTELKKTIVFITHDLDEALRLGDSIAILRDGRIVQRGSTPEIVLRPADAYVRDFVAQVNRGRVLRVGAVMQPGSVDETSGAVQLTAGMWVEEAVRQLSDAGASLGRVVDASGKVLGTVTQAALVAAMVTPPLTSP